MAVTVVAARQMVGDVATFLILASPNDTANLTVATLKTFYAPYKFLVTSVRAGLAAFPSGDPAMVDILINGVSMFDTVITIDQFTITSRVASTPYVFSSGFGSGGNIIQDGDKIEIVVTQVGSSSPGKGLHVAFKGTFETEW